MFKASRRQIKLIRATGIVPETYLHKVLIVRQGSKGTPVQIYCIDKYSNLCNISCDFQNKLLEIHDYAFFDPDNLFHRLDGPIGRYSRMWYIRGVPWIKHSN